MLYKIRCFVVQLLFFGTAYFLANSASAQVTRAACTSGAKFAIEKKYSNALLEWRQLASNASQKDWLRVNLDCLRVSGIADTDAVAFRWMIHAAGSSTYAKTQLALMHASGIGTSVDSKSAKNVLKQASAKGDEAAEFLLQVVIASEVQSVPNN